MIPIIDSARTGSGLKAAPTTRNEDSTRVLWFVVIGPLSRGLG